MKTWFPLAVPSELHFITDISEPGVLSCGLPLRMSAPYGQGHVIQSKTVA